MNDVNKGYLGDCYLEAGLAEVASQNSSNGVTPTGAMQTQQAYETTFEVSLSTLLADGDTITADSIGAKTAPAAPTAAQTANQTWTIGQSVDLSLAGAFTDPQQNDTLAYQATLSNGSALPSWLTFNSSNQTFTGAIAQTKSTGPSITVTATDTSTGLSASDTFSVTISEATSGLRAPQQQVKRSLPHPDQLRSELIRYACLREGIRPPPRKSNRSHRLKNSAV